MLAQKFFDLAQGISGELDIKRENTKKNPLNLKNKSITIFIFTLGHRLSYKTCRTAHEESIDTKIMVQNNPCKEID